MGRKSKLLRIIGIYAILIGLVVLASEATTNIDFNYYGAAGGPALQAENYFGQFFEVGWLVAIIGFIFALVWAGRLRHQVRHAKWYKYSVIVTSILTLLGAFLSVGLSRIDCGNDCVWYTLPERTAYALGVLSTLFWFAVSWLTYKFMRRNSSQD